jgi:hypothetical protein
MSQNFKSLISEKRGVHDFQSTAKTLEKQLRLEDDKTCKWRMKTLPRNSRQKSVFLSILAGGFDVSLLRISLLFYPAPMEVSV